MMTHLKRSDLPLNIRKLYDRHEKLQSLHQEFAEKRLRLADEMDHRYRRGESAIHLRLEYNELIAPHMRIVCEISDVRQDLLNALLGWIQ